MESAELTPSGHSDIEEGIAGDPGEGAPQHCSIAHSSCSIVDHEASVMQDWIASLTYAYGT